MQTVVKGPLYNNIQQAPLNVNNGVRPAVQMNFQPALQQNMPNPGTVLEAKGQEKKTFGSAVFDTVKTVAGGVAIGTVAGGAVSLLPFDNSDVVAASLFDTILNAAQESDTLPENLKNAGRPFNNAKELLKAQDGYNQIKAKEVLMSAQLKLAEAFDDDTIKSTISELSETLKNTGVDIKGIPADSVLDSGALEALKTDALIKITEAVNKNTSSVGAVAKSAAAEKIMSAKNTFFASIREFMKDAPAGDELLSSAKIQAKVASSVNLIGKAISFAVLIALITKLFDILHPSENAKKQKNAPNPDTQTPQSGQAADVWNLFARSVAQGPNTPQNNFNKFMIMG